MKKPLVMPVRTSFKSLTDNFWTDYDPRQVQQALRNSTRTLAGVNTHQLRHDLAQQAGKTVQLTAKSKYKL